MSNCPVGSYFIKVVANSVDLDQIAPRSSQSDVGLYRWLQSVSLRTRFHVTV